MKKNKPPQSASLTELTDYMLTSIMPTAEDPRDCLMELGVKPTCAASIVFGMIQKAAKGDTSAAKFVKEVAGGENEDERIDEKSNMSSFSDAMLYHLARAALEDMQRAEQ